MRGEKPAKPTGLLTKPTTVAEFCYFYSHIFEHLSCSKERERAELSQGHLDSGPFEWQLRQSAALAITAR